MADRSPSDVLGEVFAAHEHLAPPAADVLAGLDQAIAARRRTQRAVLASSGAVVAVGAVTVGVLASSSTSGTRPAASGPATATATPTASSSQASPAPTPAQATPAALPGALTFRPGWLPGRDARMTNYSIAPGSQYRGYDVAAIGTKDLYIALTVDQHGSLPTDTKRGAEHDLTVGGHPARESGGGGSYQLGVQLGGGRELTVILEDSQANATANGTSGLHDDEVAPTGRRIAEQMIYGVSDAVHPPLVLAALPTGLRITGVSGYDQILNGVHDTQATDYSLSAGAERAVDITADKGLIDDGYFPPVPPGSNDISLPNAKHPTRPVPGRDVQGHRTEVIRGQRATELVVENFEPGRDVVLDGDNSLVELDDLYAIADGMTWVG